MTASLHDMKTVIMGNRARSSQFLTDFQKNSFTAGKRSKFPTKKKPL